MLSKYGIKKYDEHGKPVNKITMDLVLEDNQTSQNSNGSGSPPPDAATGLPWKCCKVGCDTDNASDLKTCSACETVRAGTPVQISDPSKRRRLTNQGGIAVVLSKTAEGLLVTFSKTKGVQKTPDGQIKILSETEVNDYMNANPAMKQLSIQIKTGASKEEILQTFEQQTTGKDLKPELKNQLAQALGEMKNPESKPDEIVERSSSNSDKSGWFGKSWEWVKENTKKTVAGALALGALCAAPWYFKSKQDNSYSGKAADVLKRHWKPTVGLAILAAATGAYAVTRPKKDVSASAEEETPEPSWFSKTSPKESISSDDKKTAASSSKPFLTSTPGILTILAVVVFAVALTLYMRRTPASAPDDECADFFMC